MSKRIYIGNLSYSTTEDKLKELFSEFGEVISASIIKDRDTNQSKGFGFMELSDEADCDGAIAKLNGREVDGRRVRVNYAEERRNDRPRRSFDRNNRGDREYRGNRFGGERSFNRDRSYNNRDQGSSDREY